MFQRAGRATEAEVNLPALVLCNVQCCYVMSGTDSWVLADTPALPCPVPGYALLGMLRISSDRDCGAPGDGGGVQAEDQRNHAAGAVFQGHVSY